MSTVVAVPVKDLANAKQRLVSFLSPAERSDLARAMLGDVLEALARARLGSVLVVTREPEVEALAASHDAGTLLEETNHIARRILVSAGGVAAATAALAAHAASCPGCPTCVVGGEGSQ